VPSLPRASAGQRSLDLGCGGGHQRFREPLERLGFEHTGVDIAGDAPTALADVHLLPFPDRTFDVLVTSAVFEHLKQPHIAMAEAARVAKPAACFVGSIAFSEPFHVSYFHHSPLAVFELLESAGFECQSLIVSNTWSAFHAHLDMGFAGARYPKWLRCSIPNLFLGAALLHATVKRAIGRGDSALQQDRKSFARSHSAAVGFVAVRTPKAVESRLVRPIR
jgi:SAM-dependent methyltransferase